MDSEKLAGATANIAARIQKDEEKWRIVLRLIDIDGKTRTWSSTRNKEEIGDREVWFLRVAIEEFINPWQADQVGDIWKNNGKEDPP